MTMRHMMMKKCHRMMGNGGTHPLLWGALGLGVLLLLKKRGHHKIEVE